MHLPRQLLLAATVFLGGDAHGQSVALTGILGSKALLVVDGGPPKSVAAGDTYQGVKVVAIQPGQAVVEVAGTRHTLQLGAAPVSHGPWAGAALSGDNKIVLQAQSNGHFMALGQINGRSTQFMVDTGASYVSISQADAARLGIDLRAAPTTVMGTANGAVQAWRVKLHSVRIGNVVVHEVDAVVMPSAMPFALLGNSFLTRFQMTRTNDQLVLERRY